MSSPWLFESEPPSLPPISGLSLLLDYIDQAAEQKLMATIDALPWDTTWERRRQLFGYSYGRGGGQPPPIPDWGLELAERMQRENISDRPFDQMLINEYLPGQGIAMHRDYEPFDRTVVSLSLSAECVMDFRRVGDGWRESLLLPRRSLLVLSDEARYEWEHGIARRQSDRWQGQVIRRARRISVTFRSSKPGRDR